MPTDLWCHLVSLLKVTPRQLNSSLWVCFSHISNTCLPMGSREPIPCFALLCLRVRLLLYPLNSLSLTPRVFRAFPLLFALPPRGECVVLSPQPPTKHHAAAPERVPLGEGEARGLPAARRSAAKPASGSRSRSMTGGSGQAGGGGGGAGAPQPALP